MTLVNPSFEGQPGFSKLPEGWFDGGFDKETAPDMQPGYFGCSKRPVRGKSYIGLVTRDNDTWERIGQKLSQPLLKDTLYRFSISLSTSGDYISTSRLTRKETNYTAPVRLRIWGGNFDANEEVMLAESPVVAHRNWVRYEFEIKPLQFDVNQIVLEAYYGNANAATNGNLLLDNCSAFLPANAAVAAYSRGATGKNAESFDTIEIFNPSFEDFSDATNLPIGWENSGELKSKYRIHPAQVHGDIAFEPRVVFSINADAPTAIKAADRDYFTSLLASKNGLTQMITQQLGAFLKKDSTYTFSIYLAHSKHFREYIADERQIDFKNPLSLRVWGGNAKKPKNELLAETPGVVNKDWQKFQVIFTPAKQDHAYITLEAAYVSDYGKPYNGNILLDKCSPIIKIQSGQ